MTAYTLRYQLPKRAIKSDCPDCGPKHRRTLSRYVDTRTDEPLSEIYGRCDRESNCGYHLSPYHKTMAGMSYADQVYSQWKADNPLPAPAAAPAHRRANNEASSWPQTRFSTDLTSTQLVSRLSSRDIPVYSLPEDVFTSSLAHYERNQFALLLQAHLGSVVADALLARFQIGTSSYWPGACVFWLIDEQKRIRGGQVVLFEPTGHTAKRAQPDGSLKRCTNWVHYALAARYTQRQQAWPDWLTTYIDQADKFPVPFGLSQLASEPTDKPVAIVEAPKTAVLCTAYFPEFIWMAIGGLSYLNNDERLAPLRTRKLVLFPDTATGGRAYAQWSSRAEQLRGQGFSVTVSDYLEQRASEQEKVAGLDLADYLLSGWPGYPPDWDDLLPEGTIPNLIVQSITNYIHNV